MNISLEQSDQNFFLKSVFAFFVLLSLFLSYEIGNRPFAVPDEARYVEISREIAETGDFVTPKLNGVKYFEKPPLFYWTEAVNIKHFGINFSAQRATQVAIAILGLLAMFCSMLKIYGSHTAYISSSVLSTSLLFFIQSRFINLDLLLSVCLACSLFSYMLAVIKNYREKLFIRLFYVFSALACLTKGLIGCVLPGMIIWVWVLCSSYSFDEKIEKLKKSLDPIGIVLFLVIFSPWHVICGIKNKGFFEFYFIYEHFTRYLTDSHQRFQPLWYFVPIVLVGLTPWTGFLFGKIENFKRIRVDENLKFLTTWIVVVILFFSISKSKLIPYVLPVFFPLACMISEFISNYINEEKNTASSYTYLKSRKCYLNRSFYTSTFILLCALIGVFVLRNTSLQCFSNNENLKTLYIALCVICIIAIFAWELVSYYLYKNKIGKLPLVILFIVFSANIMLITNRIIPYYQEIKKPSVLDVAKNIKYNLTDNVEVFCYDDYFQDLPVYLGRTVGLVEHKGELEFGINALDDKKSFPSKKNFMKYFVEAKNRIFVVMSRYRYDQFIKDADVPHTIFHVSKNFVVIMNR